MVELVAYFSCLLSQTTVHKQLSCFSLHLRFLDKNEQHSTNSWFIDTFDFIILASFTSPAAYFVSFRPTHSRPKKANKSYSPPLNTSIHSTPAHTRYNKPTASTRHAEAKSVFLNVGSPLFCLTQVMRILRSRARYFHSPTPPTLAHPSPKQKSSPNQFTPTVLKIYIQKNIRSIFTLLAIRLRQRIGKFANRAYYYPSSPHTTATSNTKT